MAVEVERKIVINATPDDVWAVIGDFGAISDWHPAVATCDVERNGSLVHRHLRLEGGGEILERETQEDQAAHSYGYEIVSSPLPVSSYRSVFRVFPDGTGSRIEWSGEFEAEGVTPNEAAEVIAGIYEAGLNSIAARFAG